jgi:CYTH domain-containing protein
MEIERKYLIDRKKVPVALETCEFLLIEQAYLCVSPVVRVRRQNEEYILTYKGGGMMAREEYNLPLSKEGYEHLLAKADGTIITKKRYLIPLDETHTIEMDEFYGEYEGLLMAEVEFADKEDANRFVKPEWFGREVTFDSKYHNSYMSSHKYERESEE